MRVQHQFRNDWIFFVFPQLHPRKIPKLCSTIQRPAHQRGFVLLLFGKVLKFYNFRGLGSWVGGGVEKFEVC